MIFDTGFLIDVLQGEEKAVDKLKEMDKKSEPQFTTALTVFELHTGLARSNKISNEREKIIRMLEDKIILQLDTKSAEKAGLIDGSLIKEGKRIGVIDSLISGIAIEKGETVLTRNIKDFSKVQGIKIETY